MKKVVFKDEKNLLRFLDESNRIEGYVCSEVGYVLALTGHRITLPYIKGMVEALRYVEKNAHRDIEKRDVFKIHKLIMRNLLDKKNAGAFRKCLVKVGGHLCPMPKDIDELMNVWLDCAKGTDKDSFNLHCAFEKIHPFIDGNGRTGRMIWAWHELQRGREILPILNKFGGGEFGFNRQLYYMSIGNWGGYE